MDFTRPMPIGSRIQAAGGGYDHCYVIEAAKAGGETRPPVAEGRLKAELRRR